MKNLLAFVLFSILLIACSKQTDVDPALQIKSGGLFTYTIIPEGDGKITFKADSTQIIKEYLWDFGDGTAPVTTTIGTVSHTFSKNAIFQIKLTAKNSNNQIVDTKNIAVNSRLARSFQDLPQDQRNKLRVLHIIVGTRNGINPQIEIENFPFGYLNEVYQDFISHHSIVHQSELNSLSFEHHFLKLNASDSTYFSNNSNLFSYDGNPIRQFLDGNISVSQQKDIFNKTLDAKRKVGASIVIFWVPFSIGSFSGYAQSINSYTTVCTIPAQNEFNDNTVIGFRGGRFFWNTGMLMLAHEMGHNLGMAHDIIQKPCNFIMSGLGTIVNTNEQSYELFFPIFQSKDYDYTFIKTQLAVYYGVKGEQKVNFCVQEKYFISSIFNQSYLLDKVKIRGENNSGGSTFFPALESHLIEQFNIKLAPNKVTSFEKQIPRNARISINNHLQTNPIE